MSRLLKFLRLPSPERWLLVKAAAVLATVRALLWVLPFSTVRRWLGSAGRRVDRPEHTYQPPERLAWAVALAGSVVPGGGHCLSQALTLELFMLRRGHSCKMCFGVWRGEGSHFGAHAWLEHNGVVLIGGDNLHRLVRLTPPADSASGSGGTAAG